MHIIFLDLLSEKLVEKMMYVVSDIINKNGVNCGSACGANTRQHMQVYLGCLPHLKLLVL